MGKLDGRVMLVTGAGRLRGIGRATALRLAEEGADVIVSASARDPSTYPEAEQAAGWRGITQVVEELEALGRRAIAVECDVTDASAVEALVAMAITRFGRLDGIVNNAGVPSEAGASPITHTDDAVWDRTLAVNLTGVYLVSKFGARAMIEAGNGGAIVNLSSMAGRVGLPNYGGYCASKFGVIGFTQQLALELARHGIRVNAVCPGSTATDMMDGTFERSAERAGRASKDILAHVVSAIPLGRQGQASEQAAVIAFLLGPDASYVTGQSLNVDGGLRLD